MKKWSGWLWYGFMFGVLSSGICKTVHAGEFLMQVDQTRKEICFTVNNAKFFLTANPDKLIIVQGKDMPGENYASAWLRVTKPESPQTLVRRWSKCDVLSDTADVKKACLTYAKLPVTGSQQTEDKLELKLFLETIKDLPVLLVEFQITNDSDKFTTDYCYWVYGRSSTKANNYFDPDGKEYTMNNPYGLATTAPPEWLFFPAEPGGKNGMAVGVKDISLRESEGSGGFNAIYPQQTLEPGYSFGGKMVLFPANDIVEAQAVFAKLKDSKKWK